MATRPPVLMLPLVPGGRRVLDALFPLVCPGCGAAGPAVCLPCSTRLRAAPPATPPAGVDAWAAAFAYEGIARELIARMKYRNVRAVVPWLVPHLVAAATPLILPAPGRRPPALLSSGIGVAPGSVLVSWPPTTAARRRARGFDQAEVLARAVAQAMRLPCRALVRRLPGPPQTGLSASGRRVGPRLSPARGAGGVIGRHDATVLLVDDVATTGGTLEAAAAALRSAGAERVLALTAGRTPAPGRSGP